ncbi:MAG: hypothetical protein ACQEP8_01275 [Chlamydiota bacterium]
MLCWKCGYNNSDIENKIGYRSVCQQCSAWQHVCVNCKYYRPGAPNDCRAPDTEPIRDREEVNFCEEFKVTDEKTTFYTNPDEVSKRLFGEEENSKHHKTAKDKFHGLFNEE